MRKRLRQSFEENQAQAMAALARRWGNPKHVQDMVELLAKLEGELSKDSQEGARSGVAVIVIRGEGAIDPAEFRRAVDARMALEGGTNGHAGQDR